MAHFILALAVLALNAGNLTGTWSGQATDDSGTGAGAYLQLEQHGSRISGVTGASKDHAWPIKNVVYTGDHLTFTATSTDPESGAQSKWVFDLKVDGERMTGTGEGSRDGQSWKMNVTLTRQK